MRSAIQSIMWCKSSGMQMDGKVREIAHVKGYNRELKVYDCDTVFSLLPDSSLIPPTIIGA